MSKSPSFLPFIGFPLWSSSLLNETPAYDLPSSSGCPSRFLLFVSWGGRSPPGPAVSPISFFLRSATLPWVCHTTRPRSSSSSCDASSCTRASWPRSCRHEPSPRVFNRRSCPPPPSRRRSSPEPTQAVHHRLPSRRAAPGPVLRG